MCNWRAGASQSQSLQRQKFFYIYIYRNLLFFRCRNIFGRRSPSEILLHEYFSNVNFFYNYSCAYTCSCKTRAKEEDEYLPAATARARSTKDVHPALLQAAAAIVRTRIFINAHSSPPLSRFTRNFFRIGNIFGRRGSSENKVTRKFIKRKFCERKKGKLRYIYNIFVVDLPSAHERPHLPRTCRHHRLYCVHSRMATYKTPEQQEARLARRREQYRQRYAAETADAREARLERQRAGKCSA